MAKLVFMLLMITLSQICDAYKILVVFPLGGKSHNILGQGYVKLLLDAGHEVTYVTPFPTKKTNSKYHEVDISDNLKYINGEQFSLKKLIDKEVSFDFIGRLPILKNISRQSIVNENLQDFLSDPTQTFDAVIVEWLNSDSYAGFGTVFDCPLIWSSSIEPHWLILSLVHEASNPAFNSDPLSTSTPPFSFVERASRLITWIAAKAIKYFYFGPADKELYEEFFGAAVAKRGRDLTPFEDVLYNASFLLTNSHPSLSQPTAVPPNTREIGGYHIDPNTKPLPADLQKLMDGAKHGVIYFSMGSNAKSKDFPDEIKKSLLEMFGTLKQTVIWKFEVDLPNRPKNVHILQWAPQQSILAHPNCVLFITHGGLLSTTEAVYFGVPTVVMPYGADQHLNAIRAVKKGYALKVDLSYEMAADIKDAVEEMLSNPKYMERIKALSKIYHDRPVTPGKELVHWVEHVIRTHGAPHLRSPALMLPWYQKCYLDLILVILLILYAVKYVVIKIYCKIKSSLCKQAHSTVKSKKKHN